MATSLDEKIPWSKFSEVTHLEGTALEDVEALDTHGKKNSSATVLHPFNVKGQFNNHKRCHGVVIGAKQVGWTRDCSEGRELMWRSCGSRGKAVLPVEGGT